MDKLKAPFRRVRQRLTSRPSSRASHRDALVDEAPGVDARDRQTERPSAQLDTVPLQDAAVGRASSVDIAGDRKASASFREAKEIQCADKAVRHESLWEVACREVLKNDIDGKKTALITSFGFNPDSMSFDTLKHNLDAIETKINEIKAVKAEKSITIPGGPTLRLGEIQQSILGWIDRFKQIGDIIIQYDPGHAALPWAGFRFVLQAYLNYKQAADDILVVIERCTHIATRGELVERLYLRGSVGGSGLGPPNNASEPLRKNLQALYEATLGCILEAAERSNANFASKAVSAIFSEPELKQHLNNLEEKERNVSDFESLAASAIGQSQASEQTNALKSLLNIINTCTDTVKTIGGDVRAILANQRANSENAETAQQKQLLATLGAKVADGATFGSRVLEHKPQCLPDTRVELLESVLEWTRDTSGERCIYWLRGMAGTGKSTIARTVAHKLSEEGRLGASFFFSKGQGDCSKASLFVTTIAASLVSSLPDLRPCMLGVIDQHSEIFGKALRQQWEKLVLDPLKKLLCVSPKILPIIFVVDALDECEDDDDAQLILELLSQVGSVSPTQLRVFITSRPERHIGFSFNSLPQNTHHCFSLHDISEQVIDHDIEVFLQHEMTLIRKRRRLPDEWPGEENIRRMCRAAGQLFIYASTACRLMQKMPSHTKALTIILNGHQGLDQLYNGVLEHAVADRDESELIIYKEFNEELTRGFNLTIGSIVILLSPLSIPPLARLIDTDVEILRWTTRALSSILEAPEDSKAGGIRLLHPSFRDFLLDPGRCRDRFVVDEQQAHADLFLRCLKLMSESLREDICELRAPGCTTDTVDKSRVEKFLYADVQYACRYWVEHLRRSDFALRDDDQVHEFLRVHFLHWLEALSLMGVLSEGINAMKVLESKTASGGGGRLQELVHDSGRFIMKHRATIEKAPLQTYISALIFSPNRCIIRQHFSAAIPKWIKRHPVVQDHWGPLVQTFEGHSSSVDTLAFSPDGKLLASGSRDRTVRLWDAATGASRGALEGHSSYVYTLAFSPDGKLLASGSWDHTVRLWDAATGASRGALEGHSSYVRTLAFSPDGKLLASGSGDYTVRLWDAATGASRGALEGHSSHVYTLAFSPDGKLLASGSWDRTVRLWDAATGASRGALEGYSSHVYTLAFSPDGKLLASGSDDHTVRLWDAATGASRGALEGHSSYVHTVAFSPDGTTLVSESGDGIVQYWDTTTREWDRTPRIDNQIRGPTGGAPLITNQGTTDLASVGKTDNQHPNYRTQPFWHVADEWISYGQHKIVCVPVDFRPVREKYRGDIIAWADGLGRVHSIELSSSMLSSRECLKL